MQAKETLSETQLEACYASIERLSDTMLRTVHPLQYTVSLAESHCQAIALHLVNEWKVADLLGDEALSIDDIAARAALRPPYLRACGVNGCGAGAWELTRAWQRT